MRDMTSGEPYGHLWRYALPLLLGNWLQLAYNAVDSIIAGRFIGQNALAAEGIAAGMKSVGDSKTPLKFLMFSALLNAGLDLIFLGLLGFGIVCSAVTTVIAEAVSAGLAAYYMATRERALSPFGSRWKVDGDILASILKYGLPSALQQTIQPVCKVLIQGQVNALGVSSIAAFNAVTRVDDFACIPEQGIGASISTYVAQNRGAGRKDRIRPGYRAGVTLGLMYYVVICAVGLFLRRPIVSMFVTGSGADEVVRLGSEYLGVMAFFYLWPALTNAVQGFFRGMGKMFTTVVFTFVQASIRTVSTMILAPRMGIVGIAWSCLIGWSIMLFFETIYYFITCKKLGLPRKEMGT